MGRSLGHRAPIVDQFMNSGVLRVTRSGNLTNYHAIARAVERHKEAETNINCGSHVWHTPVFSSSFLIRFWPKVKNIPAIGKNDYECNMILFE